MLKTTIIITSFFAFLLAGCSNDADQLPLYGAPTVIQDGQTPLQTMCQIQEEFRALPKPVMVKKTYKAPWTSHHFGAPSVDHAGFYRIHLTAEALSFLSNHSRLEVVASLVPLFTDPDVGGEAAVLLAGIPAGRDGAQGMHTRSLGNLINDTVYQSPSSAGNWFRRANEYHSAAISLYGLTNTTEAIHRTKPANYPQTLEYEMVKVLKEFSRLPLRVFADGPPRMPQPHNEALVKSWITKHTAPSLNEKALPFLAQHQSAFAALTVFPLMPSPQSTLQRNEIYLMWMLQLEDTYWPALLQITTGLELTRAIRKAFREKSLAYVRDACKSPAQ